MAFSKFFSVSYSSMFPPIAFDFIPFLILSAWLFILPNPFVPLVFFYGQFFGISSTYISFVVSWILNYSNLSKHIWWFKASIHITGRACIVCPSVSGLVLIISNAMHLPENSFFFATEYNPILLFISWWTCRLFSFPDSCE